MMDGSYKLENLLDLSYELHKPLHTTGRIKVNVYHIDLFYIFEANEICFVVVIVH